MNKKYLAAIKRVAKSLPVFPVKAGGKIPLIKGYKENASQDPKQIEKWWTRWPSANVGVPTGSPSGIWAVDVDEKDGKSGADTLANYPDLPPTFGQVTKSGGRHHFYKYEDKFSGGTDVLGPLVDTRAEGNLVVVWPSPGYKFVGKLSEVQEAPPWLLAEVNKVGKRQSTKDTCGTSVTSKRQLAPSEINKLLRDVNVEEYRDRDSWRNMIMAVKSASSGEEYGFHALLEWSTQDAEHFGDDIEENLRAIWDTITVQREGGISAGTLIHAANKGELKQKAASGFSELPASYKWQTNDQGMLASNETNLLNMLTERDIFCPDGVDGVDDNPYFGLMVYNELKESVVFTRNPPWAVKGKKYPDQQVEEHDLSELRLHMLNHFKVGFSLAKMKEIVEVAARRSPCNPVVGYLNSLTWDGVKRIDGWIINYLGAEDNVYVKAVSRRTLIAGAARAYEPGCKVDNVLVLESDQGVGKSTAVEILGGEWAGAPEFPIGDKDAEQNLQGLWVAEWAEMATTWKKEADAIKSFLTKRSNRFRGSYGAKTRDWPRRCILIGTHNPGPTGEWLIDETGNRRYWPVRVSGVVPGRPRTIDFDGLKRDRDQLWAEAVAYYKEGEQWHLTKKENTLALKEQGNRSVKDPQTDVINAALNNGMYSDRKSISVNEVALEILEYTTRDLSKTIRNKIAGQLRSMDWLAKRTCSGGITELRFFRPEEDKELE